MPRKVYAKTKAEEDYAKHEDMHHTFNKEVLLDSILTLEDKHFDMLYYGDHTYESEKDLMDELADNIKLSVGFLNQYQHLKPRLEYLMSERQLAKFFIQRGIARFAEKPDFTIETAQEEYEPLIFKVWMRGYLGSALRFDYDGVKMPKKEVARQSR